MDAKNNQDGREQNAASSAIDRWENEGGAFGNEARDHHFGRRVEADRSWTIYHVFTGVPAHIGSTAMIGLSRSAATDGMLTLNRRNEARRRAQGSLTAGVQTAPFRIGECRR